MTRDQNTLLHSLLPDGWHTHLTTLRAEEAQQQGYTVVENEGVHGNLVCQEPSQAIEGLIFSITIGKKPNLVLFLPIQCNTNEHSPNFVLEFWPSNHKVGTTQHTGLGFYFGYPDDPQAYTGFITWIEDTKSLYLTYWPPY